MTEFRHFTCALQNWTLATIYCNSMLKMSKFVLLEHYYYNNLRCDHKFSRPATRWYCCRQYRTYPLHEGRGESAELYAADLKLWFASLWSNMLWNVTAVCVPNSASNLAHLFTETFQDVQETKQHFSVHAQWTTNKFVSVWSMGVSPPPTNMHGRVYHEFIPQGQTLNQHFCSDTLNVQEGVQWKQPEKWCTQQQCSCSLSFICARISFQYYHGHTLYPLYSQILVTYAFVCFPEIQVSTERQEISWPEHDSRTVTGYTSRIPNTGHSQMLP